MYIPMIQGAIKYAYKVDKTGGGEKRRPRVLSSRLLFFPAHIKPVVMRAKLFMRTPRLVLVVLTPLLSRLHSKVLTPLWASPVLMLEDFGTQEVEPIMRAWNHVKMIPPPKSKRQHQRAQLVWYQPELPCL